MAVDAEKVPFVPLAEPGSGEPTVQGEAQSVLEPEDEDPGYTVTLPAFEMGRTEVTNAQWKACVAAGMCPELAYARCWDQRSKSMVEADCPVVDVSWHEASVFAAWAGGRLPTEPEWAYAARSAGREQAFPWGNEAATCARTVFEDGCGKGAAWTVCSKRAGDTAQGLCDMTGNVWELTADWHEDYARVIRGSGWSSGPRFVEIAVRDIWYPEDRHPTLGFRLVRRP